jgi:uncharacterized protein (DUF488 family)
LDGTRIHTIGYEGTRLQDFIAVLQAKDVTCLLDIRDRPSSRVKGFSKNPLRLALDAAGIKYVHLRALGDPKEGRDAARRGDFAAFERIFRGHLQKHEGQADLEEVIAEAKRGQVCLMCYERDPKTCHRKIVVEAIVERGQFSVEHLGVPAGFARG